MNMRKDTLIVVMDCCSQPWKIIILVISQKNPGVDQHWQQITDDVQLIIFGKEWV
jgi:hypothetical protein